MRRRRSPEMKQLRQDRILLHAFDRLHVCISSEKFLFRHSPHDLFARLGTGRPSQTWRYGIRSDPALTVFGGKRPSKANNPGLAGDIMRKAGQNQIDGVRSYVDDPAPAASMAAFKESTLSGLVTSH